MVTAVDIGGTKTLIAQFGDGLHFENETRFATPKDVQAFVNLLIDQLSRLPNTTVLVVGAPGIVDQNGTLVRCGTLPWRNLPLKIILAKHFDCPIYIVNDAKLAALGEVNALSPLPRIGLYVTISTGIGDGIVADGKLIPALAGSEAGFISIWDGNKWQTWQHLASGKALVAHFGKMAKELSKPEEWQWVAEHLALGLYGLIPVIQPEVLIFGGSVGNYFNHFGQALQTILNKNISPYIVLPQMRQAQHPDEAVIYGAYYYAQHQQAG